MTGHLNANQVFLFDWGDTLMVDFPNQSGKMCHWPKVEMVAGADKLLSYLAGNHTIYIATSAEDSDESDIAQALQRVGLAQYISGYFCFANLGINKASPEFYPKIVQRLGVEAHQVTMIGDTLSNDIYPALESGLSAIWFNSKNTPSNGYNGKQIQTLCSLM